MTKQEKTPLTETLALSVEAEAAKTLIANMKDTLGDDADLIADTVEGETEFFEVMKRVVERIGELDAHTNGLTEYTKVIAARKSRLEQQAENLRTAVAVAMEMTGIQSRELPGATITLRKKDREPVIVDEAQIPAEFWKPQDPKLDRKSLRTEAKSGREIPGVELDNGGSVLSIRRS